MRRNLSIAAILLGTLLPLLLITQALSSPSANTPDGKAVFVASNCGNCHSVASAGIEAKMKSEKMRGPDLAGYAGKHDVEWMAKYLRKETDLDGRPHKISFKGTDEELTAMINWLLEQK